MVGFGLITRHSVFDLDRYSINLFDGLVKPRDPRFGISRCVEIPDVWVLPESRALTPRGGEKRPV